MKTAQKQQNLLTPEQAAAIANMSRWAFMLQVRAGNVRPDEVSGSRKRFKLATIKRWLEARKKAGAKKRGPQPGNGKHSK